VFSTFSVNKFTNCKFAFAAAGYLRFAGAALLEDGTCSGAEQPLCGEIAIASASAVMILDYGIAPWLIFIVRKFSAGTPFLFPALQFTFG
jgi:hypothetical protein